MKNRNVWALVEQINKRWKCYLLTQSIFVKAMVGEIIQKLIRARIQLSLLMLINKMKGSAKFYQSQGFQVIGESKGKISQGNPFPILHMKRI